MFALKTLQDKWQAKYGTRYFDSRDVDRRFSTSLYGSDRLGQNCRGKRGRGWLVHRRPIGSGDGLQKHLVATRSKHPRNGWLKWVRLPPPAPREPNLTRGSHLQVEGSQKDRSFQSLQKGVGELYFPSPMTRSASTASSFAHEPYNSAGPELQNAIRPDLNTIADPLKPFAIIDKGAV